MKLPPIMKLGITGTRHGMTERQQNALREYLADIMFICKTQSLPAEFHHGDCIGVDVQAAEMAKELGYVVVSHPGPESDCSAHHPSDEIRDPCTHFKRNRNIVDETHLLLVVPLQNEWHARGGTWYTHDYAVKKDHPIQIIYPS